MVKKSKPKKAEKAEALSLPREFPGIVDLVSKWRANRVFGAKPMDINAR